MGNDKDTPRRTPGNERLPSLILMEWQERDLATARRDQARYAQAIVAEANFHHKHNAGAWATSADRGPYPADTNKCNLFVYEVLNRAGTPVPMNVRFSWRGFGNVSYPPLANEWADPGVTIAGWEVVTNPRAGDVVAIKGDGGSGHVGIVMEPGKTMSVNTVSGNVKVKDLGFVGKDPSQAAVFRRYVGTPQPQPYAEEKWPTRGRNAP
jgi:hypothetical protein